MAKQPDDFGKARFKGVPGPSRQTMLRLSAPSYRTLTWAYRQRDDGADAGCAHHPGYSTRAPGDDAAPRSLWGLIASMWIGNAMLVVLNLR